MNNIIKEYNRSIILFSLFGFFVGCMAQEESSVADVYLVDTLVELENEKFSFTENFHYEVKRIYPSFSIDEEKLYTAQTLIDINSRYDSSWVKEYVSVAVTTLHNKKIKTAVSINDKLSDEQKENIYSADTGSTIEVDVKYFPKNNLKDNSIKVISFTSVIEPKNEAKYIGGVKDLNLYLKVTAIDQIPKNSFVGYDLVIIKFRIDENGGIINPKIFESSENEKTNLLLLEAVRNMPSWTPATYANGITISQEFALLVGNRENCNTQLLNFGKKVILSFDKGLD